MTIRENVQGEPMPDRLLVVRRRVRKPEPQISKSWREFLTGSWTRETIIGHTEGKKEDSRMEWKCVASSDTLVSYSTSADAGYGTLLFWDDSLGMSVEQGYGSVGRWKIEFDPKDNTKSAGSISGRLVDGRTGTGTILMERTSDKSYIATIDMALSDGSTMHLADRNLRQ